MNLTSDAKIADRVVRDEIDHPIKFDLFIWLHGVKLVEPIQPGHLEELLRKEESCNKIRLRTEERNVSVMNILSVIKLDIELCDVVYMTCTYFHVRFGEHAIILSHKIYGKAGWSYPSCSAVADAHDEHSLMT